MSDHEFIQTLKIILVAVSVGFFIEWLLSKMR